ncbi:MAG: DUF5652 family protein [Candidatus Margulisiibacteriota bacterium]
MFDFPNLSPTQGLLLTLVIVWSLVWKGLALWQAGKNNQLGWFICLLVLNTVGLLEITYLYFFQRNKN